MLDELEELRAGNGQAVDRFRSHGVSSCPTAQAFVVSVVAGPRFRETRCEMLPTLVCHPEPTGEGSRAPGPASRPVHRLRLPTRREVVERVQSETQVLGRLEAGPRSFACWLRMTVQGGWHLGPGWRETRSSDFAHADTWQAWQEVQPSVGSASESRRSCVTNPARPFTQGD
jgi:hypothetical protein